MAIGLEIIRASSKSPGFHDKRLWKCLHGYKDPSNRASVLLGLENK
jgi:hypothetical protein